MDKFDAVKCALGEPYYENGSALIYNMDCKIGLDLLQQFGIKIDATITSPPYNIGKEYENVLPVHEYIEWLLQISSSIFNLTKEDGAYLLNVGYLAIENVGRAVPIAYLLWDKLKFYLQQEIVWNYGAGVASKKYLSPRNEKILWYVKDKDKYTFNLDEIRDPDVKYPYQKKNGKLRCNTLGKNPSDVWQIAKVTSGTDRSSQERMGHPAQFPVDLITRLVLGFSNETELILDPFIGSGTTAEVCLKNNRCVLGFEIRQDYCDIIRKRLDDIEKEKKIKEMVLTIF